MKGDILIQRARGPDIQTRQVKAVRGYALLGASLVDQNFRLVLKMPLRCNSKRNWKICRILINRRIFIVAELVSIVFKG